MVSLQIVYSSTVAREPGSAKVLWRVGIEG